MHVKATKVLAILFSLPPEQRAGLVGHCLLCVELVKQTNGNYTVHNLGIFCLGWGSLWHFCFCRLLWLHLRINFCLFFAYRKHLRGLQFPRTGSSASSYFLITLFCARGLYISNSNLLFAEFIKMCYNKLPEHGKAHQIGVSILVCECFPCRAPSCGSAITGTRLSCALRGRCSLSL